MAKKATQAVDRPAAGPAVVVSDIGLNLREGPHKQFARLLVLEDGAAVEVLPLPFEVAVPGWVLVRTEGELCGWVASRYLRAAGR